MEKVSKNDNLSEEYLLFMIKFIAHLSSNESDSKIEQFSVLIKAMAGN